jgi:hypothetical protein
VQACKKKKKKLKILQSKTKRNECQEVRFIKFYQIFIK